MSNKEVDYKKKMKLHEVLGAKEFKKVVMKVEKVKWAITKKFFPGYLTRYEKLMRKRLDKELAKTSIEEQRKALENQYRYQILAARREFNHEENVNYHMNLARPTEIIGYLKMNKCIHEHALARNVVLAIAATGFIVSGVGVPIAMSMIALQSALAVKNWQCINLQDYNICRIELHKEALKRREKRRQELNAKKYGETSDVLERAFNNTKEPSRIPTPSEVVAQVDNLEQLRQMQAWLASIKNTQVANDATAKFRKGAK